MVFIVLKFGLKELNLIYFILLSIGIVYYINHFEVLKFKNKKPESNEIEKALKSIKKYDNNNLFLKINNNIKRFYGYLEKDSKNVDDIVFLKNRILEYINSLNVSKDDNMIDNVYNKISNILNTKLKKYKKKNRIL